MTHQWTEAGLARLLNDVKKESGMEQIKDGETPLRMSAYYYGFDPTGVREIDLILSAIACAGKAYHHTECWNDECEWAPHTGKSPVEWIQNAANSAATAMLAAREGKS